MSIEASESPPREVESSSPTAHNKRKASLSEIAVDLALPEPPSKKAKRALKKGKTLPASTSGGAGGDEDDADKKPSKKKPASEFGVWIGNLPFAATKASLRRWLVDNSGGAINDEAITRVHMPSAKPEKDKDKKSGKKSGDEAEEETKKPAGGNKGFAYVDFATFADAVAAIALSESGMGGRKLLIKNSTNFEGRPAAPAPVDGAADGSKSKAGGPKSAEGAAAGPKLTKIFVGNLGFSTTEEELQAHFEKCGPIRWVKVATFEDTGKCKGYGWVNFQDAEGAAWAAKGFVRIKEEVETVEDFMEEGKSEDPEGKDKAADSEEGDTAAVDGEDKESPDTKKPAKKPANHPRKTKTRKWWVNQLHGRTLKVELAEDDKLRYKKRFGKGAQQRQLQQQQQSTTNGELAENPAKDVGAEKKKRDINFHEDISVARLTGAVVKPQGKKVTFD